MEALDRIGDGINAVTGGIERLLTTIFGASNDREMRKLGFNRKGEVSTIAPGSVLDRINALEAKFEAFTDEDLRQTTPRYRERLKKGETLDEILPEVFALVREAGKRQLRMRHYDVQMIGGYILHKGKIAEMVTGEGKTLVATLPCVLNALAGHVHVITVNDYLARRDMEWMAPLYMSLGLTVGAIQSHMEETDPGGRIRAYNCDITYGTNNEFGFDYLRDNMKSRRDQQVQGELYYAIVDEIDNILIDEARTPLIISGPADDDVEKYREANRVAVQLKRDEHFEIKEKEHTCHMTEAGVRRAEEIAGVESFYTAENMQWPHLIDNALRAHNLYKRDVNYVVMNDEIVIVDEFTGRLMKGRQWSDGLHQAVEAKENVRVKEETQTLATITLQNYFKLYKKLCGMTGTAMTEANEFWKIYKLEVVAIPSNRPSKRANYPDVVYRTEREKYNAIVEEIREVHKTGRPILVGTTSIEKSELIGNRLGMFGIKHEVLNAKHHEREADIIAQAGRLNAVTIATNMAGRGTDIILGGNAEHMAWEQLKQTYASKLDVPKSEWDALAHKIAAEEGMVEEGRKVASVGGLHVMGTERHEARRIDLQLRGRSGRQGDPGSSRFFLSLEDDLMRIFGGEWVKNILTRLGMQEGEAIESGMVTSRIEGAQKKVEERNFDTRKNLLEYDEVMDTQRKRVYGFRQRLLDGGNVRTTVFDFLRDQVKAATAERLSDKFVVESCVKVAAQQYGLEIETRDLRGMSTEEIKLFIREEGVRQSDELIRDRIEEDLPAEVEDEREWNWQAMSKWANARWGLNTSDRELKKIGRDDVYDHLLERAKEAIERSDLSVFDTITASDFGRRELCHWLGFQFGLKLEPEQFEGLSPKAANDLIMGELKTLYRRKETEFPIIAALHNYSRPGSQEIDREALARAASDRFRVSFDAGDFASKSRAGIIEMLTAASQADLDRLDTESAAARKILDKAYGPRQAENSTDSRATNVAALEELRQWFAAALGSEISPDEFKDLTRGKAEERLEEALDNRFRPEMRGAENELILHYLDSEWKDHLHLMDHLRQGIGLVGYAQKDPKTEYKREGMRAFDQMWKRIADRVTYAILRLEDQPRFASEMWEVTSETHDTAALGIDYEAEEPVAAGSVAQSEGQSGGEAHVIDPIRNRDDKVGRNDPCPCGSGKKYKNCHMNR